LHNIICSPKISNIPKKILKKNKSSIRILDHLTKIHNSIVKILTNRIKTIIKETKIVSILIHKILKWTWSKNKEKLTMLEVIQIRSRIGRRSLLIMVILQIRRVSRQQNYFKKFKKKKILQAR
jgi:hypothetical protein